MMSLSDCAAICVLDHEDIAALAQFEHLPEVAGATLSAYLAHPAALGPGTVCKLMIDDIRSALDEGLVHQATEVVMALRQFLDENPQAAPGITLH